MSEICSRKGFKSLRLLSWAQLIEKVFNNKARPTPTETIDENLLEFMLMLLYKHKICKPPINKESHILWRLQTHLYT